MQEEVENRTLTLVVSGTKFTGRMFKAAISKYMAHRKEKKLEKQRRIYFAGNYIGRTEINTVLVVVKAK